MKKFLIILTALSLCISTAEAACNFIIKIGDNKSKIVEKIAEPMPMFEGQSMLPVSSMEICPNDNLDDDIAIEYIFLGEPENERLAAIRMVVLNDSKNTLSDKLILMNYAKKVYGNFDTGSNPKAYNNFKVWDKDKNIIIYKRMFNEEDLIEEEIYISTKEYDQKLGAFYNKIEMDELKEEITN